MVPAAYQSFFAASLGAAAALLGLLFVAVSVAPERTVGAGAPVERQVVAESVFTALINAFFISLGGAIPDFSLGTVALPLSAFSLFQTLYVGWRLWPHRFAVRSLVRRQALVAVPLAIYGLQLNVAFQLLRVPTPSGTIGGEIGLLVALYVFGIGRSWELLGARRGMLFSRLSPTFEDDGEPSATARPQMPPSVPTEAPNVAARKATTNN